MKIAYLDTIAGIAGDMTMAAFVAAGLPVDELAAELRKISLEGFELQARHVLRHGVAAVHIDVVITREPHYHRHLKDILSIIEKSRFSEQVCTRAASVFQVIAAAEARVHGTTVEKVHFHEVGALDSIVDIVGVAVCLEKFDVEAVYTSPVRLGSSALVTTQHGRMPVPTPATLEILCGYPTVLTSIPHELTTPTGAGIVRALSSGVLEEEVLTPRAVGYGAGTKELEDVPNLLRVVVGELQQPSGREEMMVVETNIDDMNPQVYPYVLEKLLASGAVDAYLTPVIMKKGRPGIVLSVLTGRPQLDAIVGILTLHTSTIGVRIHPVGRRTLPRRAVEVHTSYGPVRAKAVIRDGREMLAPEFEECRRIADERNVPLLEIMRSLEREFASR
jgi:pyridinium-3,5-bisthiocarboxylic acid mononucleotide nickel chelatase